MGETKKKLPKRKRKETTGAITASGAAIKGSLEANIADLNEATAVAWSGMFYDNTVKHSPSDLSSLVGNQDKNFLAQIAGVLTKSEDSKYQNSPVVKLNKDNQKLNESINGFIKKLDEKKSVTIPENFFSNVTEDLNDISNISEIKTLLNNEFNGFKGKNEKYNEELFEKLTNLNPVLEKLNKIDFNSVLVDGKKEDKSNINNSKSTQPIEGNIALTIVDDAKLNESIEKLNTTLLRISKVMGTSIDSNTDGIIGIIGFISLLTTTKEELIKLAEDNESKKALKTLQDFLEGNEDSIKSIVEVVNKVAENVTTDKNAKSLTSIFGFIQAITGLGEIGLFKYARMVLGVKFIKWFITEDIVSIFETLSKTVKNNEKKAVLDIAWVGQFFSGLKFVTEFGLSDRLRMRANVRFIKAFIASDIADIFKVLTSVAKETVFDKSGKPVGKTAVDLAYIGNFFDFLTKLTEIGIVKRIKMLLNIKFIKHFITSDIVSIFEEIANIANENKESAETLKQLNETFTKFFDIIDEFSIKKAIKAKIHIKLLQATIISFNESVISVLLQNLPPQEITQEIDKRITATKNSINNYNSMISEVISGTPNISEVKKATKAVFNVAKYMISLFILSKLLIIMKKALISPKDTIQIMAAISSIINVINFAVYNINSIDLGNADKILAGVKSLTIDLIITSIGLIILGALGQVIQKIEPAIIGAIESLKRIISKLNEIEDTEKAKTIVAGLLAIVIVSTIVLLVAGYIITSKPEIILGALAFAVTLGAFIFLLMKSINSVNTKELMLSMRTAMALGILVLASTVALVIGGAFLASSPDMIAGSFAFALILGGFIWILCKALSGQSIEIAMSIESAKALGLLIVICGAVLLVGGMILQGNWDLIVSTGAFALILGAFIFGLIYIISTGGAAMTMTWPLLIAIAAFVVACGAILLIGGFLFQKYPWMIATTAIFALELGAFIFGILAIFAIAAPEIVTSWPVLLAMAAFVVAAGAILLIGGFLFQKYPWMIATTAIFALELGLFVKHMLSIFDVKTVARLERALPGAKDLAILVAASAAVLLIGGGIYMKFPWLTLWVPVFGIELGAFIWGLLHVCFTKENVKGIQKALPGAKDLAILVAASAAVLLIGGGIYMKFPWLTLWVPVFGIELGAFIWGLLHVCFTKENVKGIQKALPGVKNLMILTAASAAVLLAGGLLFVIFPDLVWSVPAFGFYLGLFTFAMVKLAKYVGKNKNNIDKALLPMLALQGLVITGSIMLFVLGTVANTIDFVNTGIAAVEMFVIIAAVAFGSILLGKQITKNPADFFAGVAAIAVIIIVVGLGCIVMKKLGEVAQFNLLKMAIVAVELGAIVWLVFISALIIGGVMIGGGFILFAAGLATMVSIILFVTLSALALKVLASAMDDLNKVKKFDASVMIDNIGQVITLIKEITPLGNPKTWFKLYLASKSVQYLATTINDISEAIKDYAELKVKIFDVNTGKTTGYRKLDKKDFKEAAKNVSLIITTLGGAVIETYQKSPEMFQDPLIGKSKFAMACKAFRKLGPLITSIGHAVKDFADLKITEEWTKDKDGNLKASKYRHLDKKDFANASANVQLIISTLGGAVIEAYQKNPDIFADPLIGKSKFAMACKAFRKLGPLISSIGHAVKDFADLKITEEWTKDKDGNLKASKYRHLDKEDFIKANENVQYIITTLGGAVLAAYEKNPEMFQDPLIGSSKFAMACKAFRKLGPLISSIGHAVKDFADLKVGENYKPDKDGNLKPTEYRHLDKEDFIKANENVQYIITTLGGAVIEAYEKNPEMFQDPLIGSSKFAMACKAFKKLGPMLSTIGIAVKDFANLQVGENYKADKDGNLKPTKYRELKKDDFENAAKHVEIILTTLGGAIIKTVEKNPDMFKGTGILGKGDSKFSSAIKVNTQLAELLGKISVAVKDYADLKIPIGWDDKGNPTGYKKLEQPDFQSAADNVSLIVTTLGNAVISQVDKHKDWFDDGDDSIFSMTCKSLLNMSKMMSGIVSAIKDYADLKVAIKWDDKGNPIDYKQLVDNDFTNAGTNIGRVISTLGETVITTNKNHPEYFDDDDNSKFNVTCKSLTSMGEMLGKIANSIKDYAELKIPTKYDANGNPIEYKQLVDKDFINASNNIGLVISTLGETIIKIYNDHQNDGMFDDVPELKGGYLGTVAGQDSPFKRVVSACMTLGTMISAIAEGIQEFADMKVVELNASGKAIGYRKLTDKDFENAKRHIGTIITTLSEAIIEVYTGNEAMFDDVPEQITGGFLGLGKDKIAAKDSAFKRVVSACSTLGTMVSSIAEGISQFASMMVFNIDANGKAIGFRQLKKEDFDLAKENIAEILKTLAFAVIDVYNKNDKIFDDVPDPKDKSGNNKQSSFSKVVTSCNNLGILVSKIAEGIQNFANMLVFNVTPEGKVQGLRQLKKEDFKIAGENISDILLLLASTVNKVYFKNPILFNNTKTVNTIVNMFTKMSSMLGILGENVAYWSQMWVPTEFKVGANGQLIPTKLKTLTEPELKKAADNIKNVLTCIGKAVVETIDKNPKYFKESGGSSPVNNAVNMFSKMSNVLSSIAQSISVYANGHIVSFSGYDKDNNPIYNVYTLTEPEFKKAADNIKKILLAIGTAMTETYENNPEMFGDVTSGKGNSIVSKVVEGIKGTAEAVKKVASTIKDFGNLDENIATDLFTDSTVFPNSSLYTEKLFYALRGIGQAGVLLTFFDHNTYPSTYKNSWGYNVSFARTLTSINKHANELSPGIVAYKTILTNLFSFIKEEYEEFNKISKEITYFSENEVVDNVANITKTFSVLGQILVGAGGIKGTITKWLGTDTSLLTIIKEISKYSENFETYINSYVKTIDLLMYAVNSIYNKYQKNDTQITLFNSGFITDMLTNVIVLLSNIANILIAKIKDKDYTFIEILEKVLNKRKELFIGINILRSTLISLVSTVVDTYSGINDLFAANETNKQCFDAEVFQKNIKTVTDTVDYCAECIVGENHFTNVWHLAEKQGKILSILQDNDFVVSSLRRKISKLKSDVYAAESDLFSKEGKGLSAMMTDIMAEYNKTLTAVQNGKSTMEDGGGIGNMIDSLTEKLGGADTKKAEAMQKNVEILSGALNKLSSISLGMGKVDISGFDVISKGINKISTSINNLSLKSIIKLKGTSESIERFSQSVNGIKISNVNAITKMSDSLVKLTSKFGTLEKLVKVLSTELNATLTKLVAELKTAKDVIDKTEKIQETRHKKIDESIDLIKEIMAQELKVNVEQIRNNNNNSKSK